MRWIGNAESEQEGSVVYGVRLLAWTGAEWRPLVTETRATAGNAEISWDSEDAGMPASDFVLGTEREVRILVEPTGTNGWHSATIETDFVEVALTYR